MTTEDDVDGLARMWIGAVTPSRSTAIGPFGG